MTPTVRRPAPFLLLGLALVVAAALAPAGLHGRPGPGVVVGRSGPRCSPRPSGIFGRAGLPLARRSGAWAGCCRSSLFALPAALLAPSGGAWSSAPRSRHARSRRRPWARPRDAARAERPGSRRPRVAAARTPRRRVRSHAGQPDDRAAPGPRDAARARGPPAGVRRLSDLRGSPARPCGASDASSPRCCCDRSSGRRPSSRRAAPAEVPHDGPGARRRSASRSPVSPTTTRTGRPRSTAWG